jgi:hypothetical protein
MGCASSSPRTRIENFNAPVFSPNLEAAFRNEALELTADSAEKPESVITDISFIVNNIDLINLETMNFFIFPINEVVAIPLHLSALCFFREEEGGINPYYYLIGGSGIVFHNPYFTVGTYTGYSGIHSFNKNDLGFVYTVNPVINAYKIPFFSLFLDRFDGLLNSGVNENNYDTVDLLHFSILSNLFFKTSEFENITVFKLYYFNGYDYFPNPGFDVKYAVYNMDTGKDLKMKVIKYGAEFGYKNSIYEFAVSNFNFRDIPMGDLALGDSGDFDWSNFYLASLKFTHLLRNKLFIADSKLSLYIDSVLSFEVTLSSNTKYGIFSLAFVDAIIAQSPGFKFSYKLLF